jgi:hypothetical protein
MVDHRDFDILTKYKKYTKLVFDISVNMLTTINFTKVTKFDF